MMRRATWHRTSFGGSLAVAASLLCALSLHAQTHVPEPPAPPAEHETPADLRTPESAKSVLQDLYRRVYELQIEIARVSSQPERERLARERLDLLTRIEKVRQRVAELEAARPDAEAAADSFGLSAIAGELQKLGVEADWESIGKVFEDNAQTFGHSLAEIGKQLENMSIDVDPEGSRVRIDTGKGSKLSFTVPEDVRKQIKLGISQMGVELQKVLADSTKGGLPDEVRELLDRLPENLRGSYIVRPEIKRHVVARNVFKSFHDFELADDEIISGDLIVLGGNAYVAGEVRGNTWVLFGDVIVKGRGEIDKDAVSLGGEVVMGDRARVGGSRFDAASFLPGMGVGFLGAKGSSGWMVQSVRVGILALLVLIGFAVAGDRVERMVDHTLQVPGRDLASGTLWFPATLGAFVVAAVGLAVSVIGIPVVVVLGGAFFAVVVLAYIVGCLFLGKRFFALFADEDGRPEWAYALLGLALLEIPGLVALTLSSHTDAKALLIGLQAVDYVIKFLAVALGFGSLIATRIGGRPSPVAGEPPAQLPTPSDA